MNAWSKAWQEAMNGECDKVPKGWKTRSEIERIWGVGQAQAVRRLKDLIESGGIDVMPFRINTGAKVYPVPHYKLKQSA